MARAASRIRAASSIRVKLRNVRLRPPGAEGCVLRRELPRSVGLVGDHPNSGGILVDHAVRAVEVQEHGAGSRMTARTKADPDVVFLQEVVRAHDVINTFNLVVDVLYPGTLRGKQRDPMMHRID